MTDKLNWMYKRPTVDTEAYLLGKAIDKSVEHLETDGVPTSSEDIGNKPGALFLEAAASAALEADLKMREDPLYAIKKKEEEQRRALLNNPVRLKMMQEELERKQLAAEKKQNAKIKEKDLLAKMLKLNAKHGTNIRELLNDRSDDEHKKRKRKHSRNESQSPDRKGHREHRSSHSRHLRSPGRSSGSYRSHSTSNSRSQRHSHDAHASRREHFSSSLSHRKIDNSKTFRKMDPAEVERKRLEMMSDAKVRDEERAKNIAEYRKHEAEEETRRKTAVARGLELASSSHIGTLETRLQSTRNKLQRTRAALDKDFTKR